MMDPNHPDKQEILTRWFRAIQPILCAYYGTAGDLHFGVSDISKILEELNIGNYLEGVIHSACGGEKARKQTIYRAFESFHHEVSLMGCVRKKLINLCTGYGLASSIKTYYELTGQVISGKKVYIQGTGFVGSVAAYYLHQMGAKIVALSDKSHGLIIPANQEEAMITSMLAADGLLSQLPLALTLPAFNVQLESTPFDIFIPAAASHLVSQESVLQYIQRNSLKMIVAGANNPFIETDYIYGQCSRMADEKIVLLPDFYASSGLAIAFHYMIHVAQGLVEPEELLTHISQKLKAQLKQSIQNHCYQNNLIMASLLADFFEGEVVHQRLPNVSNPSVTQTMKTASKLGDQMNKSKRNYEHVS